MRLLNLSFKTAQENLAFEDWYFQHFEEETLRIWVNPSSVICGKHQNALAECNFSVCQELNIPIIRRISGGGTVYHDLGNVNFSFFRKVDKQKMIDYDRSLIIIQSALQKLGFPVEMSKRHDLFIGETKISGNAQHMKSGKVLHHGTILYDANLDHLRSAIKRPHGTFIDKGVKSVRSPIANLRSTLDLGSTNEFVSKLIDQLLTLNFSPLNVESKYTDELEKLIQERYQNDDWNFGYSPAYEFENEFEEWKCKLSVSRGGQIESIEINHKGKRQVELENELIGKQHFHTVLRKLLSEKNTHDLIQSELLKVLF